MRTINDAVYSPQSGRFYDSIRKLAGTLDLLDLSHSFRHLVAEAIPLDGMIISMLNPERTEIRAAYLWAGGKELDASCLPPVKYDPAGTGMQTSVIREGAAKIFDVQKHIANQKKNYIEVRPDGNSQDVSPDETEKLEVRTIMMIPMMLDGQVIGVIQTSSHEPSAYSVDHIELLSTLTAPLAVAFQNSVLFDSAKREIEERKAVEAALRESEARFRALSSELELRVEARTEALQNAVDELNGLTYSVSHDMRAPLRAMISTSRILLLDHGNELTEPARAQLLRQIEAGRKLSELVDDLLDYARHGRRTMTRTEVDLTSVFQQAAGELSRPGCSCDGACVEVQRGMLDYADATLAEVVATILIDNAGKFRREGSNPKISVGRDEKGAYFVQDDGIGFDMTYVHKLFQPFERLHHDTEYPGTGIGLANAMRIIQRHEGRMWAVSQGRNLGATFYFTFGNGSHRPG